MQLIRLNNTPTIDNMWRLHRKWCLNTNASRCDGLHHIDLWIKWKPLKWKCKDGVQPTRMMNDKWCVTQKKHVLTMTCLRWFACLRYHKWCAHASRAACVRKLEVYFWILQAARRYPWPAPAVVLMQSLAVALMIYGYEYSYWILIYWYLSVHNTFTTSNDWWRLCVFVTCEVWL